MMTWRGIGDIVVGMERQGYALSLDRPGMPGALESALRAVRDMHRAA